MKGRSFERAKPFFEPEALIAWLAEVGLSLERMGLEAGPLSPWLFEGLQKAGLPAVWIETRRMKGATAATAVKTDRNDVRASAQAIPVDWYSLGPGRAATRYG